MQNSFNNILIPGIFNAFDEKGTLKPDSIRGDIKKQLHDLKWWVTTLKQARQSHAKN